MAKKDKFPDSKHLTARIEILCELPSKVRVIKQARDAYSKAETKEAKASLRKLLFQYIDELAEDAKLASQAISGD